MEYNDQNKPAEDSLAALALTNMTERLNDLYRSVADLRSAVEAFSQRMDEAENMTSEEYGKRVVEQVANQMPTILAAANKAKRGGRR